MISIRVKIKLCAIALSYTQFWVVLNSGWKWGGKLKTLVLAVKENMSLFKIVINGVLMLNYCTVFIIINTFQILDFETFMQFVLKFVCWGLVFRCLTLTRHIRKLFIKKEVCKNFSYSPTTRIPQQKLHSEFDRTKLFEPWTVEYHKSRWTLFVVHGKYALCQHTLRSAWDKCTYKKLLLNKHHRV